MAVYTDHLGRSVVLEAVPERIISLCPSQTETLFALGAASQVAGRTRWCIEPQGLVDQVPAVGGTKKFNVSRAAGLYPDLFLCEKEENTPEMVAQAEQLAPVYVTDVRDIPSALQMIRDVGELVGCQEAAIQLVAEIERGFNALPSLQRPLRVAYLIWKDPWMVAGADTFIDAMMTKLGLVNVFAQYPGRYPEVSLSQLQDAAPDLVLLSSEPFSFGQEHVQALKSQLVHAGVEWVDGQWFSWYGARLIPTLKALPVWLDGIAGRYLAV